MKAIALGYHDVVSPDDHQPNVFSSTRRHYALSLADFRNHLDAIGRRVSRVEKVEGHRAWESTPVFLTFDDGAECALTLVADELEGRHWRGHFFVTTDWIGRPGFLTRAQIRELHARGHHIGSHSKSHPARMARLADEELAREWGESCSVLSEILGQQVRLASIPDGYYSARVAKMAAQAGIQVLFTSEPSMATAVIDGCLIVGRYFIQRHSPPDLSGEIAAGYRRPRWRQSVGWQAKKAIKVLTGELYLKVRRELLSRFFANE